jgi:glucose-6-phosphate dehydrogenase assembly protein OpcA
MQIQLEKTLDVEVVERQLAALWQQIAGDGSETDAAVWRTRVANLLVFVTDEVLLDDAHQMLDELTAVHPSRVLLMLGARAQADRDIEMAVESFSQTDKRTGARRLCCEEVTLRAQGKFVVELPSAALPLLVSDLATFVWWRAEVELADKVFADLMRAADRLVIDSAEFENPLRDLVKTDQLFKEHMAERVGVSDLNWARLTSWRGLVADFYDVPAYQDSLDRIDRVLIEYVGPESAPESVAPQALLVAGWLASRLGWELADEPPLQENDATISFKFTVSGSITSVAAAGQRGSSPTVREGVSRRSITIGLSRVEQRERKPGRLASVELRASGEEPGTLTASFIVSRSADNLHLIAEAQLGANTHRGRVLPVRNRSAANLLSRELEILCNDRIYQESVSVAAEMIARLS